jgi:replicative DNA helicase
LETAERRIFAVAEMGVAGRAVPVASALNEAFDRIDARAKRGGGPTGLMTGFGELDFLTAGLQNSEFIVVAARPAVGKTAFAVSIVRNAALELGVPVLVVSLEQSRAELVDRLLCAEARVDGQRLRRGELIREDAERLADAGDRIRRSRVFIDDTPSQSMFHVAASARRLRTKERIGLVVLDYLQLVEPDDRNNPRHEQVAAISRRLKLLARELKVPVVALAQLNRAVEARTNHRPRLSDLRESGSIEADADTVLLMHREDDSPAEVVRIEMQVAKQRNGPTGDLSLKFHTRFTRFDGIDSTSPLNGDDSDSFTGKRR